ncbi:ABC transporter ATP-binding protein, partial [Mesorhizobium sp. M7A.F.Ca.US.006.01.1.1]
MTNAASPGDVLSVGQLHSGYGRIPILNGISFDITKGEFLSILGNNGMGKTTLLRTLMGYLPATQGYVRLFGADATSRSPTARARSGVGFVPQGREIFTNLTVEENLRMGCVRAKNRDREMVEEILTIFPRLKAYLSRPGGALSGGEQQLLALARCLCSRPKLILLDEPTEGIQPSIIDEIIETLLQLSKDGTRTFLLVEQNLNFISALSQRILILEKGRIAQEVPRNVVGNHAMVHDFVET